MKTFDEFIKGYSTEALIKVALVIAQSPQSDNEDLEIINKELESRING